MTSILLEDKNNQETNYKTTLEMGKKEISAQTVLSRRGRWTRPRRQGEAYVEVSLATAAQTGVLKDIGRFVPVKDIIAGGLARAASQSTIHPLDTVKVRMQAALKGVSPATPPPSGGKYGVGLGAVSSGAVSLGKRSFASAAKAGATKMTTELALLYRGCFGAATGAGVAIGAYFAFYGTAKKLLQEKSDMPVSTIAFVAGGIGALGSSIVKVPAAVCIRSVQAGVYPNVIAAGRRITAAAGPRGLFTGYIPTLLEDVPDMAVKFAAYETLRTMHRSFTKKSKDESSTGADIAMGLIAGSVAAAATTPLDVVKTRMMCAASSRPSFGGAIRGVWQDSPAGMGRVRTFFTGVRPRAVSNGINSAIFFCFYEALRSGLIRAEAEREAQRERELTEARSNAKNGRRAYSGVSVDAVHYSTPSHVGRVTEASMTLAMSKNKRKSS